MEEPTVQHNLETTDHIQTFVIHLFRSETSREVALRQRLDVTTNGAVVVTSGLLSISFTNSDVSHIILLANVLILSVFMFVEARRYRVHASIKQRVRSIEKTYIAPLFNQIALPSKAIDYEPHIDPDLIDSLLEHKSPINRFEAIAWRLGSIYMYLFGVTYISWLNTILSGRVDEPWLDHINQQARVFDVSGVVVFFLFATAMLIALIASLYASRKASHFDSL